MAELVAKQQTNSLSIIESVDIGAVQSTLAKINQFQVVVQNHELCHFTRKSFTDIDPKTGQWIEKYAPADKADSWSIREHDVEEFSDVIKRHGLWDTGIEKFAVAVREADYQMTLDDIEREEGRVLRAVK
jgi:Putative phage metallopeptidase